MRQILDTLQICLILLAVAAAALATSRPDEQRRLRDYFVAASIAIASDVVPAITDRKLLQ